MHECILYALKLQLGNKEKHILYIPIGENSSLVYVNEHFEVGNFYKGIMLGYQLGT